MLIQLPPPDPTAAPITPPPHWSGRSCADPPPSEPQSAASTTTTSLLFECMRDQRLWACAWLSTWSFSIWCCCLFVLPDYWSGLRCPAVHRRPNFDPSEGWDCCCAPSRSQQRCSWSSPLQCRRRPNQAAATSTWPPPYSGCRPLHDFDDHDHLDLGYPGIKGLSSACGTHRFLLQSQHLRHHDAATVGDVSSSDSTFDLFSSLTVCGAPTVTAGVC
jgi:hypothetical protein